MAGRGRPRNTGQRKAQKHANNATSPVSGATASKKPRAASSPDGAPSARTRARVASADARRAAADANVWDTAVAAVRRDEKRARLAAGRTDPKTPDSSKKGRAKRRSGDGMNTAASRSPSPHANSTPRLVFLHPERVPMPTAPPRPVFRPAPGEQELLSAKEDVERCIADFKLHPHDDRPGKVAAVRQALKRWLPLFERARDRDYEPRGEEVARVDRSGRIIGCLVQTVVADSQHSYRFMDRVRDLRGHEPESREDGKLGLTLELNNMNAAMNIVQSGVRFNNNDGDEIHAPCSYPIVESGLYCQGVFSYTMEGVPPTMREVTREALIHLFGASSFSHEVRNTMAITFSTIEEAKIFAQSIHLAPLGGSVLWLRSRRP